MSLFRDIGRRVEKLSRTVKDAEEAEVESEPAGREEGATGEAEYRCPECDSHFRGQRERCPECGADAVERLE